MVERLKGKVALITGAARGQGREMAELFTREGAEAVIAGDILEPEQTDGSSVDFVRLDVTKDDDWKSVIDGIILKHGKIDILVNNAGIVLYEPILQTTNVMWDRVLDVDLKSIFRGMREVLPHMIARRQGSIVNVASIWGLAGVPSAHAYQAAKGAILNVSKNVAVTHGQDGIRCNSLHPGYIVTPMNKDQGPVIEAALINGSLLKRAGQPIETAYAALFLASDEASYITGTSLVVDGGYLAP
ncbi:SDR family NAD(P)-dependent oxidoreductase [Acidisoma silvae]|uniref:SDR family oxidoreductase n=1 Tax=Acidisoma silvae TaxID=2802396 RepID=A0A963YY15_9PROT|nr:SDR family oxidoreductase [Acidisoma silvae]MCB8878360.1 SDR family oxidoreductase [Acidisoma silvae]